MSSPTPPTRESVSVVCSACNEPTTVPFTPTPGRPVYCRACFAKKSAERGGAPARSGPPPSRGDDRVDRFGRPQHVTPRRRMLAQGRKAHFVYDVKEVLVQGKMLEENRRAFIEMLFIRGARQSTEAAYEFLEEKVKDETITDAEAVRLGNLVDRYSFWR